MDETNKVKYEQLQGKLDNDLKEWVKSDPVAARAILERRKELREMSPETRALSVMRAALRTAREKRKHDLKVMDARVYARMVAADKAGRGISEQDREVLKEASRRDMLAKQTLVNSEGVKRVEERPHVKEREPYKKRPSVRAQKRQKSNGRSMGM